jgi:hypothetical protein
VPITDNAEKGTWRASLRSVPSFELAILRAIFHPKWLTWGPQWCCQRGVTSKIPFQFDRGFALRMRGFLPGLSLITVGIGVGREM